jgi:hypothetical protein
MRRIPLVIASLAIVCSALSGMGGVAFAKSKSSIICTQLNITADVVPNGSAGFIASISGCSGNTGGGAGAVDGTQGLFTSQFTSVGMEITWPNADTTSMSLGGTPNPSKKAAKGCPSGAQIYRMKGGVDFDDTGSTHMNAKVNSKWCVAFNSSTMTVTYTLPTNGKLKF